MDVEEDPAAETLLRQFQVRPEETPVVIWQGKTVLRNPANADLADIIGIGDDLAPAGALRPHRRRRRPGRAGRRRLRRLRRAEDARPGAVATGGQAGMASRIENYLGFPAGLSGVELASRAMVQAEKFGARIAVPREATGAPPRRSGTSSPWTMARKSRRSVILAVGARYRKLGVPGEDRLQGSNVYYAATEVEAQVCQDRRRRRRRRQLRRAGGAVPLRPRARGLPGRSLQ